MIRSMIFRSVEVGVVLLAAYAFVSLPVGRHTAWGHVVAIFSTRPAHEAAEDIGTTTKQVRDRMVDEIKTRAALPDAGAAKH